MLHLLDDALAALVRRRLGNDRVDISFHAPDGEWSSAINRPTVNLFLWDLRPSAETSSGIQTVVDDDGSVVRRPAAPRMECRYLVTAWAADEGDEHRLLGSVTAALALPVDITPDLLAPPLDAVRPLPSVSLAPRQPGDRADFWSALGGHYHAGVDLQVTVTVDPGIGWAAAGPPSRVDTTVADRTEGPRRSTRRRVAGRVVDPDAVGAVVRTPHGSGRVGRDGHFLVPGRAGDELVVETTPPRTTTVPETGDVELT